MNKHSIALLTAALLLSPCGALAKSSPVELQWDELSSHLQGREIELVLPDSTALKGKVEAIRADTLVLDVTHSSNSQAHPKGNAVIPRGSVTLLSLKDSPGRWGRGIGVTLGTLSGMALGSYVAVEHTRSVGPGAATFAAISGAGSVAGYFIGRPADHRRTQIRVLP